MHSYTMALFGEAEKGDFHVPYHCDTLPQLVEAFGNPPPNTLGIYFAIQALLFKRHLIFFRVKEEGFSIQDYFKGLHLLEKEEYTPNLEAIAIPGVGSTEIINGLQPLCAVRHTILLFTEMDFFDYIMEISCA